MSTSTSTTPTPIDIYCGECGSRNVTRDATAAWSISAQAWELQSVQDQGYCDDCGGETHLREAPADPSLPPDQIIESARDHKPGVPDCTGHVRGPLTRTPIVGDGYLLSDGDADNTDPIAMIEMTGDEEYDAGVLAPTVSLLQVCHTAPHTCADPTCPGNLNARKLAAYADLVTVLNDVTRIMRSGATPAQAKEIEARALAVLSRATGKIGRFGGPADGMHNG